MRRGDVESWVVYQVTLHGKPLGLNAVCEQHEWDATEQGQPGYHTLVQAGIPTEAEAERPARGTPDPTAAQKIRLKARLS